MKPFICFTNANRAGLLLLGFMGLLVQGQAQTYRGADTILPDPTSLQVAIHPVSNSAKIQVRYENAQPEPVQIQIRSQQGSLVYDERQWQPKYAGNYDFTEFPAGTYLVEVKTSVARYVETIRIVSRSSVVVTLVGRTTNSSTINN